MYTGKFKILADGQKLHDDRIIPCAEITACARAGDERAILYGYTVKLDLPSPRSLFASDLESNFRRP